MNFNIEFQLAGLIIVAVVVIMCQGQKRLEFQTEKAFLGLLMSVVISIVCDIFSVLAINYMDKLPDLLVQLSCELYLFTIDTVAYVALCFVIVELPRRLRQRFRRLMLIPLGIQLISLIIFRTSIFFDPASGALYTYGINVNVTYAAGAFYIISMVAITILFRGKLSEKRRTASWFWLGAWIIAAFIQFLNNSILIASFAMAVACIYMYCRQENPEYHMDFATDVFNRRGFLTLMNESVRLGNRRGIVSLAIDNYMAVGEVYGSNTRNRLLNSVCDFLQTLHEPKIFRLEDNLFCIVVDRVSAIEDICGRLKVNFAKPVQIDDAKVKLEFSITYIEDISSYGSAEEIEEVIHYFSAAARKNGGVPLGINETELGKRKRSQAVQHALEEAIRTKSIEMYYQPIYNIKKGKFSSMEALVRIRDEEGNLIMPGEFIEVAEKNGMIIKLGELIFRKVCEFIRYNRTDEYGIEYIEVNLSVVQCMQEDLADRFTNIMGEYMIAPHKINFEITETAAINTQSVLESNMNRLLNYGSTFSLDDYGSGYSNLTYVVGMPLKIIKIDRSLTIAYDVSKKAKVATEYSVEMIHKLGMEIVVEGIETEEQYMNFKNLGVEYIQGYYFSKPLPQDRVLGFIKEWL